MSDEGLGQVNSSFPVFIVGVPRSGTTLVQQILGAHPNLAIPWESHFIPHFPHLLQRFGDLREPGVRARLIRSIDYFAATVHEDSKDGKWLPGLHENAERVAAGAAPHYAGIVEAIFTYYADQLGKPRWGDKTPGNISYMGRISAMFPNAKFIHVVRDGRDVALSTLGLSFGANTVYRAARHWKKLVQRGIDFEREAPGALLRVRYEDILLDPEREARCMCAFIGEEFRPEMLEYHSQHGHATGKPPQREMHAKANQPVDMNRGTRWRREMSLRQQRVFEAVAGKFLEEFSYERTVPGATITRMEASLYKIADAALTYRPFQKPYSLWERRQIERNRSAFELNPTAFGPPVLRR